MLQKIIQVGNSIAVTIPKSFATQKKWKVGQIIHVDTHPSTEELRIRKKNASSPSIPQTVEVKEWLKQFNKRYKVALTELANK